MGNNQASGWIYICKSSWPGLLRHMIQHWHMNLECDYLWRKCHENRKKEILAKDPIDSASITEVFSIQFLITKLWWGTFRPLGRSFMNVYLEEHNWKLIWHAEIAKSKHLFDETTLKTYSDSIVYIIKRYFSCFHTWPLCL